MSLFLTANLAAEAVRAAIDFGSGAVKIQAAPIDLESNTIAGKPLLETYTQLGLTEDVAIHQGSISDEMQLKAIQTLQEFKARALLAASGREVEFGGIATAIFRKAQNGKEVLERFEKEVGIRFQILSQEDEGKLGYYTAKVLFPHIPEADLLAWDSGNGSFQMTAQHGNTLQSYLGPLGHGTVRLFLSSEMRGHPILQGHDSVNPVSIGEAKILVNKIENMLPISPEWLQTKLESHAFIACFGDGESIFALVARALAFLKGTFEVVQNSQFSRLDVQYVMDAYLEKDDQVFDEAGLHRKTLTCALLLHTVMKHFDINVVHYARSIGSTPGMLIDPLFWTEKATK